MVCGAIKASNKKKTKTPKTLWMTSADPSVSHNWLRCLFLSLGAGAWKAVSMEDVQRSIMNQQDGTFRFSCSFSPPVVGK